VVALCLMGGCPGIVLSVALHLMNLLYYFSFSASVGLGRLVNVGVTVLSN